MANINQYTQENTPVAVNQGRPAQADDFGGNQSGLMAQAQSGSAMADALGNAGAQIGAIEAKRQNRIETINRVREADQYYNEMFEEFNRVQTEEDMVDPATADKFAQKAREKAALLIQNHSGSEESRAMLESKILGFQGDFTRQITQNSIGAQRKFVMSKASDQINALANKAKENPRLLGDIFKETDAIIGEFSSALYPEDEMALISAAQEQISLNAMYAYIDSGQYSDAKALIDENPFFVQSLQPETQRKVLTEIQNGINAETKQKREIQNKILAIKTAAKELGVEVPGAQIFSAVTGIENAQGPAAKVDEFAKIIGKDVKDLTPSIIAKVGYGVDLPAASEIDYNKEFTPSGDLTPKGIGGKVKEPFDRAAAVKTYKDKIDGAVALFENTGNSQALLSAMITFQKALDEGAVVREGDIVLQRSAQGLAAQINGLIDKIGNGQPVSSELVTQMSATMNDFSSSALKNERAFIDPLLDEADRLGYRRVNILPRETYDNVFGGVKEPPKGEKKITSGATITADEFLRQ